MGNARSHTTRASTEPERISDTGIFVGILHCLLLNSHRGSWCGSHIGRYAIERKSKLLELRDKEEEVDLKRGWTHELRGSQNPE